VAGGGAAAEKSGDGGEVFYVVVIPLIIRSLHQASIFLFEPDPLFSQIPERRQGRGLLTFS
jgi:hypothetical protein